MSKMVVPDSNNAQSKKVQVENMFDNIAPKYDLLNHVLSLNIDKIWRRKVVKIVSRRKPQRILDVATGTCDLAIAAARKAKPQLINGIDISEEMLNVGQKKISKLELASKIELQKADAENIPFADNTFDSVTVAFGVRNFENLEAGLKEMHHVLNDKGICVILEFTLPTAFPVKQLYNFYFRRILPLIGKKISKDKSAYTYLPESVRAFPQRSDFVQIMQKCGFHSSSYKTLSLGIAAIYIGEK
ncbi:MAG: bifunctional demethylmenaquinone methyltransferase/2-methoxy-6-polyprenyl-1,4-benzoquinol methylase UbiE [Salinivirgaceae bacterium]|nr:bifunctional demethylmenaquinone methyltransferase/2-methoxy-6-polyprenyl-1,4-benzoquinol methylase UbiE [Salinivirgaceae bacterium]